MRPFLHQTYDCLFVFLFFFFYLGKQTQFYLFLSLVLSPYRELLWSPVSTDFCRIVYCTCSAWLICSYSKVKAHTVSNFFHDHSCWIHTSLWFSVFVEPMLHIASQRRQQKKITQSKNEQVSPVMPSIARFFSNFPFWQNSLNFKRDDRNAATQI